MVVYSCTDGGGGKEVVEVCEVAKVCELMVDVLPVVLLVVLKVV